MLDIIYRKRVQHDLPVWVARGWVRPECADDLLASVPGRDLRERLPAIIAMLGAILLVLGGLTFVAANWSGLSRPLRLTLLFGTLWIAYGGAIWLRARGWAVLYEAAVVVGCGIFGANIMLIAQMYHIDRHYPDGIMIWGLGTLFAAGLSRSVAAVVTGFALLAVWTAIESGEFAWPVHWPFLVAWFAAAWLVWYERWTLGINAAALALFAWIVAATISLDGHFAWVGDATASAVVTFAAIAGLALATRFEAKLERRDGIVWRMFSTQGLILVFVLLFILQLTADTGRALVWAGAAGSWPFADLQIVVPVAAAIVALAAIALSVAQGGLTRKDAAVLSIVTAAGLACALFAIPAALAIVMVASVYFGLTVWTINLGQRRHHGGAINLGFAAFGVEALYVYFKTIGSLLDTALFFLAGGVALVVIAIVIERFRRRMIAGDSTRHREQPA